MDPVQRSSERRKHIEVQLTPCRNKRHKNRHILDPNLRTYSYCRVRRKSSPPSASMSARPIKSSEQQSQFLRPDPDPRLPRLRCRPAERAALQPFRANPEPAGIPDQNLQAGATLVGEHEKVAAEGILRELVADQFAQAVEASTHVRGGGGQEDACRRTEGDHAAQTAWMSLRTRSGCQSAGSTTIRPLGSSIL